MEEQKVQSGKKVALGIFGFVVGFIVLLIILKLVLGF
jgi:tetrahydromethanopterin S-methyltransferase subunit F